MAAMAGPNVSRSAVRSASSLPPLCASTKTAEWNAFTPPNVQLSLDRGNRCDCFGITQQHHEQRVPPPARRPRGPIRTMRRDRCQTLKVGPGSRVLRRLIVRSYEAGSERDGVSSWDWRGTAT